MQEKIEMVKYTCDGCESQHFIDPGTEPPHGFHGHVSYIGSSGGTGANWFACRERCIKKAVLEAIDRSFR